MVLAAGTGSARPSATSPATVWAERTKARCGSRPTPAPCSSRSIRKPTACSPTAAPRTAAWCPQGRRTTAVNLQETGQAGGLSTATASVWSSPPLAERSRNGDMVGGDFRLADRPVRRQGHHRPHRPTRRVPLFGCPHYGKCGIEKNIRNRNAHLVIANHALVPTRPDRGRKPTCPSTWSSTKATTCLTPRILLQRRLSGMEPPSCGAGCWARRATGVAGPGLRGAWKKSSPSTRLPTCSNRSSRACTPCPGRLVPAPARRHPDGR